MRTLQSEDTHKRLVAEVMLCTGWSKHRVLKAMAELEEEKLVRFSSDGSFRLRVV